MSKHLIVRVEVWQGLHLVRRYDMDHDDPAQRRVLGEQCRNAFEGGQRIVTYTVNSKGSKA